MKTTVTRLTLVYLTCLMFLFISNTVSFGDVYPITGGDNRDNLWLNVEEIWCEKDNGAKLHFHAVDNDGYADTESIVLRDTVCNFDPGPGWAFQVREDPTGDIDIDAATGEIRYFTAAFRVDPGVEVVIVEFVGFPGFHAADFHPAACWDHRAVWGNGEKSGNWTRIARTPFFDAVPADGGWHFYIIDLAQWAIDHCPYNDDCAAGSWSIIAMGVDTDWPDTKGEVYFDEFNFTQTLREAEKIERTRAVSPADKLTTTWGVIKAQF